MRRPYNRSLPPARYADERPPYDGEERYDPRYPEARYAEDGRYWEVYPPEPRARHGQDDAYGWGEPRYDRPVIRPDYMPREAAYGAYQGSYREDIHPSARSRRGYREQYHPSHPIHEASDELEERLAHLEDLMRERAEAQPYQAEERRENARASIDGIMADLNRRLAEMEGEAPHPDEAPATAAVHTAPERTSAPRPRRESRVEPVETETLHRGKSGTDFSALFDKIAKLEAGLTQLSGNVSTLSGALDKSASQQGERLDHMRLGVDGLAERITEEVRNTKPDAHWFDNLEKAVADISRRQRELDGKPLPDNYIKALDAQFANLTQHTRNSTQAIEGQIRTLAQMLGDMAKAAPQVDLKPLALELQKITRKMEAGEARTPAALDKLEEHLGTLALTMARVQDMVAKDLKSTMQGVDQKIDKLQQTSLRPVMDRLSEMEANLKSRDPAPLMTEVRQQLATLAGAVEDFSPQGDGITVKAMQEMRADLQRLHARLDDLAPSDLGKIEEGIRTLSMRLSELGDTNSSYQNFSMIDTRLTDLGEQIDAFGGQLPSPEAQKALEGRLTALVEQLSEAGGQGSNAEFARVEAGIRSLMENYQETKGLIGRFDRLESGINRLIDVLSEAPAGAMQPAAQQPAEPVAKPAIPAAQAPASAPAASVANVETAAPAKEWAPSLSPDTGEEPVEPALHKEPEIDVVALALAEENSDEYRPLEPGTKEFKPRIEDAKATTPGSGATTASRHGGAAFVDQASFISAARKAAKSANMEAMRQYEAQEARKGAGGLNAIRARLAQNKRVLIYAFAGLSILVSSIVLITPVLKQSLAGDAQAEGAAPAAAGAIAPPAAETPKLAKPAEAAPAEQGAAPAVSPNASKANDIKIIIKPKGENTSDAGATAPSRLVEARPLLSQVSRALQTPTADAATREDVKFDVKALSDKLAQAGQENQASLDTASLATREPAADMKLPEDFGTRKLRHAVALGEPEALIEVARRYAEGDGVATSLEKAAYWYERAAGSGSALAQYRIGSLYEKGSGVEKDKGLAKLWYQRAAEQGNTKAMHNLAVIYTQSEGISQPDFKTAGQWFRRAAELGVTDSQFNLGVLYGRGMGMEQNLVESYKWFSIAARNGDTGAGQKRDEVYQLLDDTQRQEAMRLAEEWVPQAIIEAANFVTLDKDHWGLSAAEFATLPEAEKVRRTQSYLGQIGYDAGPADGRMGPKTMQAIQSFKADMGLGADAEITLDTLEMLRERASL